MNGSVCCLVIDYMQYIWNDIAVQILTCYQFTYPEWQQPLRQIYDRKPTKFDVEKSSEFPLETKQGNIEEIL